MDKNDITGCDNKTAPLPTALVVHFFCLFLFFFESPLGKVKLGDFEQQRTAIGVKEVVA